MPSNLVYHMVNDVWFQYRRINFTLYEKLRNRLRLTTVSTALLSDIRQVSIFVYTILYYVYNICIYAAGYIPVDVMKFSL